MEHVEFIHKYHFDLYYHRKKATGTLSKFIHFFWETNFDALWQRYPEGFVDVLFPNTSYTYLINLGTPFVMQLDNEPFTIRKDGLLPRLKHIRAHHKSGNRVFGIKFKVSPVLLEKQIDFSEYTNRIAPLSYLIDPAILCSIRHASSFQSRIEIISQYYSRIIDKKMPVYPAAKIVSEVVNQFEQNNRYTCSVKELAQQFDISARTLQRYFEVTTGISCKRTLQIIRIRKAIEHLIKSPDSFDCREYGYFDRSHFNKHLRTFLRNYTSRTRLLEEIN